MRIYQATVNGRGLLIIMISHVSLLRPPRGDGLICKLRNTEIPRVGKKRGGSEINTIICNQSFDCLIQAGPTIKPLTMDNVRGEPEKESWKQNVPGLMKS